MPVCLHCLHPFPFPFLNQHKKLSADSATSAQSVTLDDNKMQQIRICALHLDANMCKEAMTQKIPVQHTPVTL
jgi:hypothetical protein